MMRAYDIYESAMVLLGYCDGNGEISEDEGFKKRAVVCINQILTELFSKECIEKLTDNVKLEAQEFSAAVYGVAMLLSLGECDSEKNSVFARIYNAKRAAIKCKGLKIADNMPIISEV